MLDRQCECKVVVKIKSKKKSFYIQATYELTEQPSVKCELKNPNQIIKFR